MNDEITISRRAQKFIIICLLVISSLVGIIGTCVFYDTALDVLGLLVSLIFVFFIMFSAIALLFIKVYKSHSKVESDEVESDEVEPDEVESDEVESNEVKNDNPTVNDSK